MQTVVDENGNEVAAIHLSVDAFAPWTGAKREAIACMPDALELHSTPARAYPYMRTGQANIVTCPLCKQTESYTRIIRDQKPKRVEN